MTDPSPDTIFALSSGSPPAAIAVVRISGTRAPAALKALTGRLPEPRRASMATLRDPASGETLDKGLVLLFRGPSTATGEDLAELHLHGGRSVVAAVLAALAALDGLRPAQAGEFTRRAFESGRIDLAEAEGLADLLAAETEAQRRAALALAGGALSRKIEEWQQRLLTTCGRIEADLDFADESDVAATDNPEWQISLAIIADEVSFLLTKPAMDRIKDGVTVVIAGPPNAGKSTLHNALVGREAAITSTVPGTTRDVIETPVAIGGTAFLLVDTAGLRDGGDEIERIGVERARGRLADADIILWLGGREAAVDSPNMINVHSKSDIEPADTDVDLNVSGKTGAGLDRLTSLMIERASALLPREGELAVNARHRILLDAALQHVQEASDSADPLIAAEALRHARLAFDRITGRAGVEDMLDSLFARFCIGK